MERSEKGIAGVVLAGGQGRRMGSVDKGLREFRGRPLAAWAIERLAPQVDELFVSANRNVEVYAGFGHPVIGDVVAGYAGPLAGLHAALTHAARPLLATVPCDSPFLPADLVARLAAGLDAAGATIAVARTGGRLHPVFCLCRRELLPGLADYLARGERRFETWFRAQRAVEVDFDDEAEAFVNINTVDELDALG
ncbi:MAG: molybdenum cofactor guanylyltransferase [Rhodocyclaceae bacterium]|nr:molybdenum cofactor guanylyltransferase [Rhodocyclaceae bacterium]